MSSSAGWRNLSPDEMAALTRNGNSADDWTQVSVTDGFDPARVQGCRFFGPVRLGAFAAQWLEHDGLRLPVGLYNSMIVSCDIGGDAAIHNVGCLANYVIADQVVLFNVGEMQSSATARFGCGTLNEGEDESQRAWVAVWNEIGGRGILAFDGILPADAYIWAKSRDNAPLMKRFVEMTDARSRGRAEDSRGTVGSRASIRHCRTIRDVAVGEEARLSGANLLQNLTIRSDAQERTEIGEGVELRDGIVGYGCHVLYGVKAIRFALGTRVTLEYGARLFDTLVGDNSTIACCEVLNNLIFPSHEQHHNNSFLIATLVQGQSNIAAGATVGSNHNSRANDGEIVAGRGFWPGLCASLKHNCRFASFTLLAKGAYPAELDTHGLPFSLLSNDESCDCLQIMPAYWFLYNMYAVVRNAWKFRARDRRVHKAQNIEFDYLAPDTVEEMFLALGLLEEWVGKAAFRARGESSEAVQIESVRSEGRRLLNESPKDVARLEVLAEGVENSRRKVVVLKAAPACAAYREMANYYAVQNLLRFVADEGVSDLKALKETLPPERVAQWTNVGGQIVATRDLDALKSAVVSGQLDSWDAVHAEYDRLWRRYPRDKAAHALGVLLAIERYASEELDAARWSDCLDRAAATQDKIARLTRESRAKDYTSSFRKITFDTQEEMDAVVGTMDGNSFVRQVEEESREFRQTVERAKRLAAAP